MIEVFGDFDWSGFVVVCYYYDLVRLVVVIVYVLMMY